MNQLLIKNSDAVERSRLKAFLHFIKIGEVAFGFPDVARSPPELNDSIDSIQSAHEALEDWKRSPSNETLFESVCSNYVTLESLENETLVSSPHIASSSSNFKLAPSENQVLLSELLQRVSTTSSQSPASTSLNKLESSKIIKNSLKQNTSTNSKKSDNGQKDQKMHRNLSAATSTFNFVKTESASFEDTEVAKVVHDLVFEKYEESYMRLLNKLKKLHFSDEEYRFRGVVNELERVLNIKNANRQNRPSSEELSTPNTKHVEDAATSPNSYPVYSSTDSELGLETKPIGIPQSGQLEKTFTKPTCMSVNQESDQFAYHLDTKNFERSSQENVEDDIKIINKYLSDPQVVKHNLAGPVFKVEAQVYACNVEEDHSNNASDSNATVADEHQRLLNQRKSYNKSLDLPGTIKNLNQIAKVTDNSSQSSTSRLVRTETNESYESEYNEYNFLRTALGDELLEATSSNEYLFPPTASIATDDISELLSSTSSIAQNRRRRCRNRRSTETISNAYSKSLSLRNVAPQKEIPVIKKSSTLDGSSTCPSYEDVTDIYQAGSTNRGKKLIKNRIFVHETIIDQAERALEYGRRKIRSFIGSPAHLEAERTLLVSKIRRQALINTLYMIQEAPSETLGRVTIENLRCTLNAIRNGDHSLEQYFMCILQYKTTVYSTRVAAPNRLGWVDFGGCFIFDNVTNTFNIKIELYVLQVSQVTQNCFVFPFLRPASKLPMVKFVGETYIGIMNRKHEKFSLLYRDGDKFRDHKLTASIQTSIKWPDTVRGFLTIGIEKHDQQPIWNRRWCVLEDGKLKYYNYPSDESYCKPVGTLDLETCKCCDETNRKYLRQKTLALFVDGGNDFKIYYISPDNTEEFNVWRKNLDVILRLIKEWNMF